MSTNLVVINVGHVGAQELNGDDQEGKIINIHNQEDQQLIPNEFYVVWQVRE